jgi:hypothetical protein
VPAATGCLNEHRTAQATPPGRGCCTRIAKISYMAGKDDSGGQRGVLGGLGLSEAVVVTLVTGLAYCFCYAATVGEATYYGIPQRLISITSPQVLSLAVLLLVVFGLPIAAFLYIRPRLLRIVGIWQTCAYAFIISFSILVSCVSFVTHILLVSGIFLSAVAVLIVLLTLSLRKIGPNGREVQLPFVMAFYILCFVVAGMGIAYAIGFNDARTTDTYRIIQKGDYQGYAIVWMVSDEIVLAQKYDPASQQLMQNVAMLKLDKDAIEWRWRKTGPLDDVYSSWH